MNGANQRVDSNYCISIDLNNTNQTKEIDGIKPELMAYLRTKLKNSTITLKYKIIEGKKISLTDNKSIFDSLSKENQSLVKFRKMFNLDIDF